MSVQDLLPPLTSCSVNVTFHVSIPPPLPAAITHSEPENLCLLLVQSSWASSAYTKTSPMLHAAVRYWQSQLAAWLITSLT